MAKVSQLLQIAASMCVAIPLMAQQSPQQAALSPLFQIAQITGDQYTGFRKSCMILFADGRFHRERLVQEWVGGRGVPKWNAPEVFEGSVSAEEIRTVVAEIDDPTFSSISGVIGHVRNPSIGLWMGGPEIVPRQGIDLVVASIAHPNTPQVFEVAEGAKTEAQLAGFLERVKSMEKRSATQLPPSQTNECASLSDYSHNESIRKPASVGLQFPISRDPKPNLPSDSAKGGLVKLELLINPDGNVGEVKVNSATSTDLEPIAIDTVKKLTFYPARLLDIPIAFRAELDLKFGNQPGVTLNPQKQLHSSLGRD